ncbi:hypothetical protein VUJ46_18695 [Chryseobacterium sp. MYb264]|uniref:hypothetical protein n=1 Tax=Chryseobacterium sp. MYb264 TaxID=2745153 RepID=UPI002E15D902|nr:hypothetical protein VUJ46_18695 [Chryseobacterium sp. MYb264]
MKKNLLFAGFLVVNTISAQIGISTNSPQGAFHVDGGKDNNVSGAPTATQQLNDFIVTSAGRVGVGTIAPNTKFEINSGTSNASGLAFTNFNSTAPISTGQTLGVDSSGNVVSLANPAAASVTTVEVASSTGTAFNVNDLGYTAVTGSSQSITVPTGGKAVFINFMLGIDYTSFPEGSGGGYYQATLFIDGSPSTVYQRTQERDTTGSQTQYTLNTVKFLTAGSHTLDVRMIRALNNGTTSGANMACLPISMSFNASYIN